MRNVVHYCVWLRKIICSCVTEYSFKGESLTNCCYCHCRILTTTAFQSSQLLQLSVEVKCFGTHKKVTSQNALNHADLAECGQGWHEIDTLRCLFQLVSFSGPKKPVQCTDQTPLLANQFSTAMLVQIIFETLRGHQLFYTVDLAELQHERL